MATHPKTFLTPDQYLEIERNADCKSKYFNGEMFAVAGAQQAHNQLVASDRVHVDLYSRQPDGRWLLSSANRLEDSVKLESVGAQLLLADLYEKVDLA